MGILRATKHFSRNSLLSLNMAAMKAMKAMKKAMKARKAAMKAGGAMTQTGVFQSVAETTGLKTKEVKGVVDALMGVAVEQVKKSGSFKLAGMLNMKLKNKPATPARKGVNPFTKEPCVFKAKPASKTVRAFPMKKLKELINRAVFIILVCSGA